MQLKKIFTIFCLMFPFFMAAQTFVVIETMGLPAKRHECAAAVVDDCMYLFGGRGNRPVNRYNFKNNSWDSVAKMPMVMNHFQAASYKNEIFIAGAFTGNYPHEKPIAEVYAFNTKTFTWRVETVIPQDRQRGAAACIIYKDKLYLIAGIVDGHYAGHVTWMDVYDFKTKQWSRLPDAPHARDHFQAVVVNNQFFVAGGRKSSAATNQTFQLTVLEVDVYDLSTNSWSSFDSTKNIPAPRAGCTSVPYGKNSFMVIGGESGQQQASHNHADVFDMKKEMGLTA